MKKQDRIEYVRPAGHGHYKVCIKKYNKFYTAITTDMQTIDDYKDGSVQAAINLYDHVMRRYSDPYSYFDTLKT